MSNETERVASISDYRLPEWRATGGFPRWQVEKAILETVNERLLDGCFTVDGAKAVVAQVEAEVFVYFRGSAS